MNELTTSGNVLNDIRKIIEEGRRQAYAVAGQIAITTYWNIGRRIVEEEQHGQERAKYGTKLIANLARQLTLEFGSGYGKRSLEQYRRFYLSFKDMEIANACVRNLTWTHFRIIMRDYYIDLVFYNYRMKRFVLFELKTHKLTHQDVGQLDMYVRMFDDLVKGEDDNPTLGVLLCTETDKTIARYSVLHESEQLFASKYMAYMPTEEELRQEIEQQKQFFLALHGKDEPLKED